MKDIIERMNKDYMLSPDRRTVYGAIALLIDLLYLALMNDNSKKVAKYYASFCQGNIAITEIKILNEQGATVGIKVADNATFYKQAVGQSC